jgi:hypothetical protein
MDGKEVEKKLCEKCKSFFGIEATKWMCSVCYKFRENYSGAANLPNRKKQSNQRKSQLRNHPRVLHKYQES